MHKTIAVGELEHQFQMVFDEVVHERVPYVLARDDHPEAALIPYDDFVRFQRWQEQDILDEFDRALERTAAQNAGYGEEEIAADISAAREEVGRAQDTR